MLPESLKDENNLKKKNRVGSIDTTNEIDHT
jgi:hypothetical protein